MDIERGLKMLGLTKTKRVLNKHTYQFRDFKAIHIHIKRERTHTHMLLFKENCNVEDDNSTYNSNKTDGKMLVSNKTDTTRFVSNMLQIVQVGWNMH